MPSQTNLAQLPVGFGAMRITGPGIWGPPREEAEAIALLRRAIEKGVTFIDTAASYGPGISETLIAKALYPYPTQLMVATKGGLLRPGANRWVADRLFRQSFPRAPDCIDSASNAAAKPAKIRRCVMTSILRGVALVGQIVKPRGVQTIGSLGASAIRATTYAWSSIH